MSKVKTNPAQQNIPHGWKNHIVSDLCVSLDNRRIPITKSDRISGDIPYYGATGIIDHIAGYTFDEEILLIGEDGADWSPYVNKAFIVKGKSWVNNHAHVLKCNNLSTHEYLEQYLNWKNLDVYTTGGTRKKLNKEVLMNIQVCLPESKTEQQKISEILGSVDEDIQKTQEVINETEKLKRGLMQQLFTRGIGHTKFKKTKLGEIPDEWEVGELGSYLLRNPDYGINAAGVDYTEELPTYIRITDISYDGKFISENKKSVDHKDSENYLLQEGDLLFARTGASVGKTYLYNPDDGKLVFAGFLIRVRTNEEKLLAKYFSYFVQAPIYWNWVRVMSTRSGQPGINGNEYAGMVIPVPRLSEQKKYIKILSAVDEKISVNRKLKEKLSLLKRGLMQDLLSGKVRVK